MKNRFFIFFLLLLTLSSKLQAQIVNIPDANFKSALIALGLDTNADGDIQQLEADVVSSLNLNANNISSLVGIEAFGNLLTLYCDANNLLSLDVSTLTHLIGLSCSANTLSSLNIIGCDSLFSLDCHNNQLLNLDVSTCDSLQYLNCGQNLIGNLDVSNCSKLEDLEVSDCLSLQNLNCPNSKLFVLNINGSTNLINLNCANSMIPSLDVSFCPNLQSLDISNTPINSLDVSACLSLISLQVSNSQVSYVDAHGTALPSLQIADCAYLNELNLSNCASLQAISIDNCHALEIGLFNIQACNSLHTLSITHSGLQGIAYAPINVSAYPNLQSIDISNSAITDLDASNCNILDNLIVTNSEVVNLDCHGTLLSSLDASNLPNLQLLHTQNCQLSNLTITNCPNLQDLNCANNQLTTLSLTGNSSLMMLNFSTNQITSLIGLSSPILSEVYASNNPLTNLIIPNPINLLEANNCSNLTYLLCNTSSISITGSTSISTLKCSGGGNVGALSGLDVSACPNLQVFDCSHNALQSLDISNNPNLDSLDCSFNALITLDASNAPNLSYLACNDNQLMTTLFVKNGSNESYIGFYGNPSLQYICADNSQVFDLQQAATGSEVINSFCSYTPGGNYNTITGKSTLDIDNNGCTIIDPIYSYLLLEINDGTSSNYTATNVASHYTAYTDAGNYTLTPQFQNPNYFSATPAVVSFPNNLSNQQTEDFCITSNATFADVEIVIMPLMPAQAGFNAQYNLLIHNKGTSVANGNFSLDFMGNKMTFVNASQATSAQTANQLTWNYSNLQPFESRSITFTMNLLPPPTNNIGDILNFSASMPLANDADGYDNYFTFVQNVVGSYDPNDKTCLEGNLLNNDKIGDYLHYLIRFQNTGNYPADHVVVVDSINVNQFDIPSLQILETSHNAHINVNQGVLQFYFENIQLADSFSNEPASHGYVLFKIKTKANLPQNSSVQNKAEIYFDYNLPVVTNTAITTFGNTIGVFDAIQNPHFQLYPNPAQNSLTIKTEKPADFVVLNVLGEMVISKHISNKENLDISALSQGVYFIQAKNTNYGQKFVKE